MISVIAWFLIVMVLAAFFLPVFVMLQLIQNRKKSNWTKHE